MVYDPTIWKDRIVENPKTYTIQDNVDGTITLVPAPGVVTEEGTPVSAANLNKLEQGLKTHEENNVYQNEVHGMKVNNGMLQVYNLDLQRWLDANKLLVADISGSPGSETLIDGDMQAGYFGTVPSSELITGTVLASAVGISQGISQFTNEGWLKFSYEGRILFVAKKPIRHSISWDNINAAGCVFGTKTVTIGGLTYKVRLMKTGLVDPMTGSNGVHVHSSEWNKLMLPIHVEANIKSWASPNNVEDDVPYWHINFTDKDLHTHDENGDGTYTWCQETYTTSRLYRGRTGVSYASTVVPGNTASSFGWRPCLELV